MLPNFVIIGERRSGTTSLARWIEAHPELFLHPKIDMGYFIDDVLVGRREWMDGEPDYSAWDKTHSKEGYAAFFKDAKGKKAVGEKSADYLFWRPAHERMKRIIPDAKYLVTLRNPVDRAWSMYWNEVGKGREKLSFEEAFQKEEERIKNSAYARDHLSYFARGRYVESFNDFFQVFPKEQVKVIVLEHVIKDTRAVLEDLYAFLGVSTDQGYDRIGNRYNNSWTTVPRSFWTKHKVLKYAEEAVNRVIKTASKVIPNARVRRNIVLTLEKPFRKTKEDFKMNPETRKMLLEYYRPYNEQLEKLLGIDLSAWKK